MQTRRGFFGTVAAAIAGALGYGLGIDRNAITSSPDEVVERKPRYRFAKNYHYGVVHISAEEMDAARASPGSFFRRCPSFSARQSAPPGGPPVK